MVFVVASERRGEEGGRKGGRERWWFLSRSERGRQGAGGGVFCSPGIYKANTRFYGNRGPPGRGCMIASPRPPLTPLASSALPFRSSHYIGGRALSPPPPSPFSPSFPPPRPRWRPAWKKNEMVGGERELSWLSRRRLLLIKLAVLNKCFKF